MAEFGEIADDAADEAVEQLQTIGQVPAIRRGLLSLTTFPSMLPDGPAIAPSPVLRGPLDHDVQAEVLRDILDGQARLPTLAPAQRSGDPAIWDGRRLDPPASPITGLLDTDTHAEVLRDIQKAQAQLPSLLPRSVYSLGNGGASDISSPSSSGGPGSAGFGDGSTIGVPGIDQSAAGDGLESLDGDAGDRPSGIDTAASGFGFDALSGRVYSRAASRRPAASPSRITSQRSYDGGRPGQSPSLFSKAAAPTPPRFTGDYNFEFRTDRPALVQRDGQSYVWVETPSGTRLVPYVTMSAGVPSSGLSPADRLGLQIMNPVSAIMSTGAGLARAKPSTQDAILLGGSAVETPLYAAGSIGLSARARATEAAGGPYSNLIDPPSMGPGKRYTKVQRANIYQQNMRINGGVLRSDVTGRELVMPSKSRSGVTPPENEAQIDHMNPLVPSDPSGTPGSNSYKNALVLSRVHNRAKSNN